MKEQIKAILEEQRSVPEDAEITSKEELEEMSDDEYGNSETTEAFTTTRSGSAIFPVQFIADNTAKAFLMTGIGDSQDEYILNGGAGNQHYSGMAVRLSEQNLSGNVLNEDKDEIPELAKRGDPISDITAVASIPVGGIRIGEMLGDKFGEEYNPQKGFFAGDKLKDTTRGHLKRTNNLDEVYEAYGTSEMGIMATEVEGKDHENRVLMPLLDQYSFEIWPLDEAQKSAKNSEEANSGVLLQEGPDSTEELQDIRNVEEPTIGRIYPSREGLKRYDQMDAVEVYPGDQLVEGWPDPIPGIKVLGRLNGMTAGGVTITDTDAERVFQEVAPDGNVPEFHFSKNGTTSDPVVLIESVHDISREELEQAFETYVPEMNYADENGYLDWDYSQTDQPGFARNERGKVKRFSDNTVG